MRVLLGVAIFALWLAVIRTATMDVDRHVCQEAGHFYRRPWQLRWYGCRLKLGRGWTSPDYSDALWGDDDPMNEACKVYRECTNAGAHNQGSGAYGIASGGRYGAGKSNMNWHGD